MECHQSATPALCANRKTVSCLIRVYIRQESLSFFVIHWSSFLDFEVCIPTLVLAISCASYTW